MRLIGAAERGMQLMAERALSRKVFGKFIAQHGSFLSEMAKVISVNSRFGKNSRNSTVLPLWGN